MLVETIQSQTKRDVVIHQHSLETIQKEKWWNIIKDYPTKYPDEYGRDGFYCLYKVFLANELIDKIDEDDYIYYTDSSAYHREPFEQNIDRLFDYVDYNGHVCGSAGNDFKHSSHGCCDNINIWKTIWPECESELSVLLRKPHVLASWYVFKKNKINKQFLKDWVYYSTYILNGKPLCTYHHTVDQSIFNILLYKYDFKVFYNDTHHDHNKNHNNVHRQLNLEEIGDIESLKKWFVNPKYL